MIEFVIEVESSFSLFESADSMSSVLCATLRGNMEDSFFCNLLLHDFYIPAVNLI